MSPGAMSEWTAHHELDLKEIAARSYFKLGSHWFMAQRVDIITETSVGSPRRGREPIREADLIDMRLVHAPWRGCDE